MTKKPIVITTSGSLFPSPTEDIEQELVRGREFARLLLCHMLVMGVGKAVFPGSLGNHDFRLTVEIKESTSNEGVRIFV